MKEILSKMVTETNPHFIESSGSVYRLRHKREAKLKRRKSFTKKQRDSRNCISINLKYIKKESEARYCCELHDEYPLASLKA